jgi:hypothetical protein
VDLPPWLFAPFRSGGAAPGSEHVQCQFALPRSQPGTSQSPGSPGIAHHGWMEASDDGEPADRVFIQAPDSFPGCRRVAVTRRSEERKQNCQTSGLGPNGFEGCGVLPKEASGWKWEAQFVWVKGGWRRPHDRLGDLPKAVIFELASLREPVPWNRWAPTC